jgi:hypothetical protein
VNADAGRSSFRITVKPAGILKMYVREQEMDAPAGCTSAALIEKLGIPSKLRIFALINAQDSLPELSRKVPTRRLSKRTED